MRALSLPQLLRALNLRVPVPLGCRLFSSEWDPIDDTGSRVRHKLEAVHWLV